MSEEENTGEAITGAADQVDAVQTESQDSGEQKESQTVPLEALQAERAQRQGLQDELRVIKDHIVLMQTQQSQPRQESPKDAMDALSDDDVLTVGEGKKLLSTMERQHQTSIQELRMTQQHPDYQDVVTKYLPDVLNKNPALRKTLTDSQDFELAYYLAKNSDAYKTSSKKEKKHADAERIVRNSQVVGSLASVGSTSPINQARRYKEMSDDDFQKLTNRNMG